MYQIPHPPRSSRPIANLIASLIEDTGKNAVRASFNLHTVAQILEAKSKKVRSGLTEQEKKDAFYQAMDELFKATISKA